MKQGNLNPIEERFWKYLRKNPKCFTGVCFAASIWGRNIPEKVIDRYFDLVDKEDYDIREKDLVMAHLYSLTKDDINLDLLEKEKYVITSDEKEYLRTIKCGSNKPS